METKFYVQIHYSLKDQVKSLNANMILSNQNINTLVVKKKN